MGGGVYLKGAFNAHSPKLGGVCLLEIPLPGMYHTIDVLA